MRPVAQLFFVIIAEYLKLQSACPGDFPFTYAQLVKRVDDGTASLGDSVRAVKL